MPLFYNAGTSSPSIEPLPEVIVVDDRGVRSCIDFAENSIGEFIDRVDFVREIIDCLKRDETAELELEYLCLDSASQRDEDYVRAIREAGTILYERLHLLGLYRRGFMPYVYAGDRVHGFELVRRDVLKRRIKRELNEELMWATRLAMKKLNEKRGSRE